LGLFVDPVTDAQEITAGLPAALLPLEQAMRRHGRHARGVRM